MLSKYIILYEILLWIIFIYYLAWVGSVDKEAISPYIWVINCKRSRGSSDWSNMILVLHLVIVLNIIELFLFSNLWHKSQLHVASINRHKFVAGKVLPSVVQGRGHLVKRKENTPSYFNLSSCVYLVSFYVILFLLNSFKTIFLKSRIEKICICYKGTEEVQFYLVC